MVKKNTCHTIHASHNSQSGYETYGVLKNRKTYKSENEQGDILSKCFIMIGKNLLHTQGYYIKLYVKHKGKM